MRKMRTFMERQEGVSKWNVLGTLLSTFVVFFLVAYATQKNVCVLFEATKSAIFSMTMAAVWSGVCATISLWSSDEHHIMPQIRMNILPVGTYVMGNVLLQITISFLQALIGTCIFDWFFDYSNTGYIFPNANIDILFTLFIIIYSSAMLGLFVGLLLSNIKSAMIMLPLLLISQMLFSKGIFELDSAIDKISNFIIARYGIASLGSILNVNQYPLAMKVKYPMIEQLPNELFEASAEYITECWICMGVLTIVPIITAYVLLCHRKNKKA